MFSNCKSNETIKVQGTVGNKFFFSSTQRFTEEERSELLLNMETDIKLANKLDEYYKYQNQGDEENAKLILESEEELRNTNEFGLGALYILTKMYENDILFKPMIQCHQFHESHLISLSEDQLTQLEPFLNSKEVEVTLLKIEKIEMDRITLYKLVDFRLVAGIK